MRRFSSYPLSAWTWPTASHPPEAYVGRLGQALSYFGESFMLQLEGLDKYKTIANNIRLPVLLNLAACKLKRALHHEADALCSEVLQADATSVKALFRRGAARRALGNDDGAREDLTKCAPLAHPWGLPMRETNLRTAHAARTVDICGHSRASRGQASG